MKCNILFIGNNKYTKQAGQEKYHHFLIGILKNNFACNIHEYHHNLHPLTPDAYKPYNDVKEFKSNFFIMHKIPKIMPTRLVTKNLKYSMKYFKNHIDLKKYDLIIDSTQGTFKYIDKWKNKYNSKRLWIQHQSSSFFNYSFLLGKFGKLIYKIFSVFGIKTHAFYAENGVFFTNEDADDFYKKFHCKCKRFIATPSFDIIKSWKNNIASRQDIVYVGRIEQIQKNIKFLIKLSKYLNCNIHVYGIGPQHHLVESNPYKIIYHKGLSASDVKTIYQKYKYTILVSKFEGYAFVLSESLSNGVPIIVRDTFVSAKYIADNGNNGFLLLKKYNAKKCAKLINEIIENDTKYLDRCKNCISFQSKIDFKKSWIKIFNHFLQNH